MFRDVAEALPLLVVSLIPLAAVIGGITAGIVKSNSRQRLLELAQRERIAAIERGIDPDKLPAIHLPDAGGNGLGFATRQLRRSQALTIWGIVSCAFSIGLFVVIGFVDGPDEAVPALLFLAVGIALLISGRLVRPDPEEVRREREIALRGPA